MRLASVLSVLLIAGIARAAGGGAPAAAAPPQPKPGAISGRVVLAPGIPATACRVSLEGASLSAGCNSSGAFILKEVQPGEYDVVISVSGIGETRLATGVGDGQTTYVGDVVVGVPGAVMGVISAASSSDLDLTVVCIPDLGLYTTPNISGAYLLSGVPSGTWNVFVLPPGQTAISRSVTVQPGRPTTNVNFHIEPAPLPTPTK